MAWGKLSTDSEYWGADGIIPYLSPSVTQVFMYLTALLGSLRRPKSVTLAEIVEQTRLSNDAASRAVRTLAELGLFIVRKERDDHGHWYRTFIKGEPPWNAIAIKEFIEIRKAAAAKRSNTVRQTVQKHGNLCRGPSPESSGKAASGDTGEGQPRKHPESIPGDGRIPSSVTPEKLEEVVEDEEGGDSAGAAAGFASSLDNEKEITFSEWKARDRLGADALESGLRRISREP